MHEILIYFFTPCLPNVLVTKESTVRVFFGSFMHLEAHVGIWGKLKPLFGSFSYGPPGQGVLCEVGGAVFCGYQ